MAPINSIFVVIFLWHLVDAPNPQVLYKQAPPPPMVTSPPVDQQLQPIASTAECKQAVSLHCSKHSDSDWETLACLQADDNILQDLSIECQNILWQRKYHLTQKGTFEKGLSEKCLHAFQNISECNSISPPAFYVPCLIENKNLIDSPGCRAELNRAAVLIFSDYQLVYHFVESCREDINRLGCGRIEIGPRSPAEERDHLTVKSQGKTIHCLTTHINQLKDTCSKQVLRVAELQSDDYHLDLPLYYACREDRERLCPHVESGEGQVYLCLDKNKYNPQMSAKCRTKISERQQLRALDYFVDFRLAKACAADLKKSGCSSTDKARSDATVARMLLCLETFERPHFSPDKERVIEPVQLDAACKGEVIRLRQEMLDDYRLSPDLLSHCHTTIEKHCASKKHGRGTMLHCLAHLIRSYSVERPPKDCEKAVYELVKITNVEENVILDPVIDRACRGILTTKCSGLENQGHGALFECLSANRLHPSMTDSCRGHLMELMYFVTRDVTLDDHLHRACAEDSLKLCAIPKGSAEFNSPDAQLLTCLYNHRRSTEKKTPTSNVISESCNAQVMRLVHARAAAVSLDPRLFEVCLADLTQCDEEEDSDYYEDEEEEFPEDSDTNEDRRAKQVKRQRKPEKREKLTGMRCLQKRYRELQPECRAAVAQVSAEAQDDASLDKSVMDECDAAAARFCPASTDEGQLLRCLIEHKNHPDMEPECRESVEEMQLIAQQEWQISRLNHYCSYDAQKYCPKEMTQSTSAVIVCLSELLTPHRPESLSGPAKGAVVQPPSVLSPACHKELVFQLYARGESIVLDPELVQACSADQKQFCANVPPGAGRVIECLRKHRTQLSKDCHAKLFKRDELEAYENQADYSLFKACQQMINVHCAPLSQVGGATNGALVECLTLAMTNELTRHNFDSTCRNHLVELLDLHSRDYRLDAVLQSSCRSDISKFCLNEAMATWNSPYEQNGPVLHCLKKHFVEQKRQDQMLNAKCYARVRLLLTWENALHHLDPILAGACKHDILNNCPHKIHTADGEDEADMDDHVRECLTDALRKDKLQSNECKHEVILMVKEGQSDLHVDPVLHEACALEVQQICGDIEPGHGRQMACLLRVMSRPDADTVLGPACHRQLSNRLELWSYVAKYQEPESIGEFISQVNASHSRNYILIALFAFFSVIFIVGLCCGRVTKRVPIDVKTK